MKAIRGATTVICDTPEEIRASVKELLVKIKEDNLLNSENTICILFSSTSDIHSFYPAKAAREAGFFTCPLFSNVEPDICGALPKCIRVMVLAEIDTQPKHVYLKEAKKLRKDLTNKINIAIDGPAGSGKSSVAKAVSKLYNILHLDTGAMYRACALSCINANVDCNNPSSVEEHLSGVDVSVLYENGTQKTLLDGVDVSGDIRTPQVSNLASIVSAHTYVRHKMVELQRKIATQNSCVLDGRDIGTNVLPDAEFKFFLTASPEVRAKRRLDENSTKGYTQSFEEVLKDIKLRDEQDSTRAVAPLLKAGDAIEINTDGMTLEEVVNVVASNIQRKI